MRIMIKEMEKISNCEILSFQITIIQVYINRVIILHVVYDWFILKKYRYGFAAAMDLITHIITYLISFYPN